MISVDSWFDAFDHPLKAEMQRVRQIIMAADARITECIKWQTPTFSFNGNLASFNPRSKKHVSLLFHTGALIPGDHPRLQGGNKSARYMQFVDMADVDAQRDDLRVLVTTWCDLKSDVADEPVATTPPVAETARPGAANRTATATPTTANLAAAKKAPADKAPAKKAPAKTAVAKKSSSSKVAAK